MWSTISFAVFLAAPHAFEIFPFASILPFSVSIKKISNGAAAQESEVDARPKWWNRGCSTRPFSSWTTSGFPLFLLLIEELIQSFLYIKCPKSWIGVVVLVIVIVYDFRFSVAGSDLESWIVLRRLNVESWNVVLGWILNGKKLNFVKQLFFKVESHLPRLWEMLFFVLGFSILSPFWLLGMGSLS